MREAHPGRRAPEPGDIVVCLACGSVNTLRHDGKQGLLSANVLVMLPNSQKNEILNTAFIHRDRWLQVVRSELAPGDPEIAVFDALAEVHPRASLEQLRGLAAPLLTPQLPH
jgi:hypothetical protein